MVHTLHIDFKGRVVIVENVVNPSIARPSQLQSLESFRRDDSFDFFNQTRSFRNEFLKRTREISGIAVL